ncbi:tRNA uridine-5-carboxymethylaminomethyl(34) synthesis GTPase MnmE [Desulfosarcina sp.]|uniref:tRNA uridine-5-carboxymethylaminomethyl(34) synthesis GTPase MnmE n=1 Tax=Desulfosarcina sp. TaxID=2027861 RepID=UPI00356A05F0
MTNNTIAAISTPLGPGGIGVVRISGPCAYTIMKRLFLRKQPCRPRYGRSSEENQFRSHFVYYGHLVEPLNQTIIDEALAIYMKGPKSFTREDVVEFHSHSGFVVLDRILHLVVDAGAVLSAPGEFSKRAFLNGRIDLTQAEAVIDLINAPCEFAVQMASHQVAGGLRDVLAALTATITRLQAVCEANIEFDESVEDDPVHSTVQEMLSQSILPEVTELIKRQKDTAIFKEGVLLAIAGAPNVGKSSLLNRLVERETAIVSEVPGTTRDIVRDYFSINGVPVVICDTAGIHDTQDPIECLGIKKARDHFHRADIVLLVVEASRKLNAFEKNLIEELQHTRMIVVINKDDIADDDAVADTQQITQHIPQAKVSAKTGHGVANLKGLIFKDLVSGKNRGDHGGATPNLRQRIILEKTMRELQRCLAAAETEQPLDVISGLLTEVLHLLDGISGRRKTEDLYDHIFSQFCIGK